tara:strand:- start:3356 stop:3619 length:264 start_codon:yes stop_codon:yes gene_type:complete
MKMSDNLRKIANKTLKAGAEFPTLWNEAIDQLEREGWYEFYDEHEIPVPLDELALAVASVWQQWRDENEREERKLDPNYGTYEPDEW